MWNFHLPPKVTTPTENLFEYLKHASPADRILLSCCVSSDKFKNHGAIIKKMSNYAITDVLNCWWWNVFRNKNKEECVCVSSANETIFARLYKLSYPLQWHWIARFKRNFEIFFRSASTSIAAPQFEQPRNPHPSSNDFPNPPLLFRSSEGGQNMFLLMNEDSGCNCRLVTILSVFGKIDAENYGLKGYQSPGLCPSHNFRM